MTEENKIEVKDETCKCFCQSKGFRKFIVIASGTFVGVFCALSLFAALHKPPMPPCHFGCPHMRPMMMQHHHFQRHKCYHGEFHKKMQHKNFEKKPQVKVEIED